MKQPPRCLRILSVLCLLALLAACGSPGPRPDREPLPDNRAERLWESGNYLAAAQEFERLAEETRDPGLLVRAGEAWLEADRIDNVRDVLERIRGQFLPPNLEARADFLRAEVELANNLPADALAVLPDASFLPMEYRIRWLDLRARALLAVGDPWASVNERLTLDALLYDPEARDQNLDQMFTAMQRMPLAEIDLRMREVPATGDLYGWLALARVMKTRLFAGEPLDEALISWRQRFPDHPAAAGRVNQLMSDYGAGLKPPDRVALLLPLSGRFAAAGQAVRDGVFLAHFDAGLGQTTVKVYDTGGTAEGAVVALENALYDGVDAIIGPLQKESVAAVAQVASPLKTLVLNLPDTPVDNENPFYIFGLSPEDEARRAAELAISEGHRRALIMVPTDQWGRRVGDAFAIRFERLGGWVVGATQYNHAEQDYSGRIRPLMKLTDSELRHQSIERILGTDVAFEAQPRDDVDVIFAAARSQQGRLIRPQLRFHKAGDIPVYATSSVFAGSEDPSRDIDLNGVAFCDATWMIDQNIDPELSRSRLQRAFPAISGNAARLYALGVDAYRVLPFLGWLSAHPDDRYPGLTGNLWVDGKQVQRELACARFRGGVPATLAEGIGIDDA